MGQKRRPVGPATIYVAERLRDAKAATGMTFETLAERSGVPRATAAKALSGESAIDTEVLLALCPPLGLDAGRLLSEASRLR